MKLSLLLLFTVLTTFTFLSAQERSIALFDLSQRNSESNNSKLFSAEHILKVTGVDFKITKSFEDALSFAMILCSSEINSKSFTDDEKASLIEYISNGGILITPRMLDKDLFSLFGITSFTSSKSNYKINWSENLSEKYFNWMDEPNEKQISLGDEKFSQIMKTYSYVIDDATILGTYTNGNAAAIKNKKEKGYVYSFGVSWKDIILRSQINRDYEAQRISGNGFEPTQDVFMLFIRAIATEHIPFLIWKHTSSGNSNSNLMITHDIDSSSGMDMMSAFANSENEINISTNYNITVRYFSDVLNTDFYNNRTIEITGLIDKGHTIGSHSVGHFPDFGNGIIFPIGTKGNTKTNYSPYNNGNKTSGGSVFGECEVSKNMLENDFPLKIRSFRSGHLAYNDKLVNVLDSLEYDYNSSNSANDVLTHFPYQNIMSRSFSGKRSRVYELPLTISDVFKEIPFNEENYKDKVDVWLDVLKKTNNNSASAVLLIHPNREYKLKAQELLLSQLHEGIYIEEMNAFGAFWKARETLEFTTEIKDNIAYVTVLNENVALDKNISFIISDGQELDNVIMNDGNGNSLDYLSASWNDRDLILYHTNVLRTYKTSTLSLSTFSNSKKTLKIYPNPVKNIMHVEIDLKYQTNLQLKLVNLLGQVVYKSKQFNYSSGRQKITFDRNKFNVLSGIYLCIIKTDENEKFAKKVILK